MPKTKALAHRSRLRHTRRVDDAAAECPALPSTPHAVLSALVARLRGAPDLLAQVEALGDAKGQIAHGGYPGPTLSACLAYIYQLVGAPPCSPLLRPALTLLQAARAAAPGEVDGSLQGVLRGSCRGAEGAEAAHRVFLWVALLEDSALRAPAGARPGRLARLARHAPGAG